MEYTVLVQPDAARHDLAGHPESQARLEQALAGVPPRERLHLPTVAGGTEEAVSRVHAPAYIAALRARCAALPEGQAGYLDPDTYIRRHSYGTALSAAGYAIEASRLALAGTSAFAFVRPPGHHAERTHGMGFCLFNNVAVAAMDALAMTERVAIVDWDVHHGNGTQSAFYTTDRVLYCSVHRRFHFPGTGWYSELGAGRGAGYTLNAPLPAGSTGPDYDHIFRTVFCPAIAAYRPGLVLVSAGQDALAGDPLGGMALEPRDFGAMTRHLLEVAARPLALVLEGGYGPRHGEAVAAILRALKGEEGRHEMTGVPGREARLVGEMLAAGSPLLDGPIEDRAEGERDGPVTPHLSGPDVHTLTRK